MTFAIDENTGYAHTLLLGVAVENESFQLDGIDSHVLVGRVLDAEVQAAGPGECWNRVAVHGPSDGVASAAIERAKSQRAFHPPVNEAAYTIDIEGGAKGCAAAFYAIDIVLIPDNPHERDEAGNATQAGSELLETEGMFLRRALLLAELATPGDIDYFGFAAMAGGQASAVCESESGGSSVRGLRAQLENAAGDVLVSGTETPAANLKLPATVLSGDGETYFLRLSASGEEPLPHEAAWVRCALTVTP